MQNAQRPLAKFALIPAAFFAFATAAHAGANPVADLAKVTLGAKSIGGSAAPAVGLNVLSPTPTSGSVATVTLAPSSRAVVAVGNTTLLDTAPTASPIIINAGGGTVLGAGSTTPQAVAVNLASTTTSTGTVATVTANPSRVYVKLGNTMIADTASNASPITATAGGATLLGGAPGAAVGASVLSPSTATGTLLTGGVVSGAAPATAVLGGLSVIGG